jgi:hypothetical protein
MHGLGEDLLKQLLELASINSVKHSDLPNPLYISTNNYDDLEVTREKTNFDVLGISKQSNLVFLIENKIKSSEGENQLERYRDRLNNNPRFNGFKKIFIYLTPDGDIPSDISYWAAISYSDILRMLETSFDRKFKEMTVDAQLFIRHYIDLIRRFVLSELNQELKNACKKIYEKHKQLIDILMQNIHLDLPRKTAIDRFLEHIKAKEIYISSSATRFHFLTNELYEAIPSLELERNWAGQKNGKPIQLWFEFYEQVKLVLEIGPLNDSEMRKSLVDHFYNAFEKKTTKSQGGTYTRVWSAQDANINFNDQPSEDEIFESMVNLFNQFKDSGGIDKIKDIVLKVWNQKQTQ